MNLFRGLRSLPARQFVLAFKDPAPVFDKEGNWLESRRVEERSW